MTFVLGHRYFFGHFHNDNIYNLIVKCGKLDVLLDDLALESLVGGITSLFPKCVCAQYVYTIELI